MNGVRPISENVSIAGNPLFLLSFRQRDEIAAMAERAGWSPIAARRADHAERRFILSEAHIAVVDARGAFEDGLAAVKSLADPAEANASALLVLVSRNDTEGLDALFAAGATHYLASPFGEEEFAQTLRFAKRYAARLGNALGYGPLRSRDAEKQKPDWRLDAKSETVTLEPEFAADLSLSGTVSFEAFLRALGDKVDEDARAAIFRVRQSGEHSAFAHARGDNDRLVHHLRIDPATGDIIARVERPDRKAEPRSLVQRDPLTGLGNAQLARQWIGDRLAERKPGEGGLVVLLVSLHRFDMINEGFGRGAGDAVLQGMARRIEKLVDGASPRRRRLIGRLAGAEFVIGLPSPASLEEAEFLAQRIGDALAQPFVSEGQSVQVSMRCGIAFAGTEDGDAASLLRRASAALAEAREREGPAICVYDAAKKDSAARVNRLEIDLRPALDSDEIEILFQPQVATDSGNIVSVEALARWRHPAFGELGAATLFAAAESADYLVELSRHVQRKAASVAAAWPESLRSLRVAINVTAADMALPDFADSFTTIIDETGIERSRVTVEVTESGLIENLDDAAAKLETLRTAGFRTAIDDFGTGYSSLAYLKTLPLDYLKIDRRLSEEITGSERDRVVVRGVIEMAKSLGLAVIAEGVETGQQLALLTEEGCGFYQGFLCSPPVTSDGLMELVKTSG